MDDYKKFARISLPEGHRKSAATHRVNGDVVGEVHALEIVWMDDAQGFYLLYFDRRAIEITDTFHESVRGAMDQAEFEFGVAPSAWEVL